MPLTEDVQELLNDLIFRRGNNSVEALGNLGASPAFVQLGTPATGPAGAAAPPTFHTVTLTGSGGSIRLPAPAPGLEVQVLITQDGTGTRTITWDSATNGGTGIKWQGAAAPVLTTTAGRTDLVTLRCIDGASWLGSSILNFG